MISVYQPRPQSLLGVQNGGMKKTLANNRSRDHKISQSRARRHLKQSKFPIFLETRDLFARVFFAPTRHLESGDGPGDEVDQCTPNLTILQDLYEVSIEGASL